MSKKTASPNSKPISRRLNFGPGIVIALAISALLAAQYIKTETAKQNAYKSAPIVEQSVYQDPSGPTPDVSYIIIRSGSLKLTVTQQTRLAALQAEWNTMYAPKLEAADRAAEDARKYLSSVHGKARIPVSQIEDQAGSVIALSREISSARIRYWDKALQILNSHQRSVLKRDRETDWSKKMDALRVNSSPK